MEHQPSGTAQYSSIPGCSEWGSSFLSDESCPTLSAPCHTSLSVSCLHPNEGKYEQNVSVKCKNQATNMWDTQFPIISYCPHKFPTTKKVKGEFQTFFFLFGIDHWLGYRIHGDKHRIHRQHCAMPFTSPQGQDSLLHVSSHASWLCIVMACF